MNDDKLVSAYDILIGKMRTYELADKGLFSDWLRSAINTDDTWEANLDEREMKEVKFAVNYAANYAHGTAGHNRLMLIAKLNALLDTYEDALHGLVDYIETGRMG